VSFRIINSGAFAERPKAVLFDLDDTLYDFTGVQAKAMEAVRGKIVRSLNVAGPAFDEAFAKARLEVKAHLGPTASSHSRLLYFQRTIELLGFRTQVLLALDLEQTFWRTLLSTAQLFAGAEELLIELRAIGIPLAVVTDLTTQIQFRKLIYFGIERYFDVVVTSEEAAIEKVGMVPFRMALEKLELEQNDRVWIIGDSSADIVQGKQALNCCTIQRCDTVSRAKIYPEADAAFNSFPNLQTAIIKDIL